MASAFLFSVMLSSIYYYNSIMSFFAFSDPVPWLRSRLGREVVLVMYGVCALQFSFRVLSPLAYLCPFCINTLFSIMFLFAMALYLTLSHGSTAQYAHENGEIFAWWSATLAMRQSIVHFVWFLYNLTEAITGLMPKSLYTACDCVFVFCFGLVLSRVVFDFIDLWPLQPTPQPRRKTNITWFENPFPTVTFHRSLTTLFVGRFSGAYIGEFDPITQTTTTIVGPLISIVTHFRSGNDTISTNASKLVTILVLHTTHKSTLDQTQSSTAIVIVVVAVVTMFPEKTTPIAAHCRMCSLQPCVGGACVHVHVKIKIQ